MRLILFVLPLPLLVTCCCFTVTPGVETQAELKALCTHAVNHYQNIKRKIRKWISYNLMQSLGRRTSFESYVVEAKWNLKVLVATDLRRAVPCCRHRCGSVVNIMRYSLMCLCAGKRTGSRIAELNRTKLRS